MWTYEVGSKNTFADGSLRLNGAVFYSDYTDFQARVSEVVDPDAPVPTLQLPGAERRLARDLRRRARGAWVPLTGLTLQAQVGYLNAYYGEFTEHGPRTRAACRSMRDRSGDEPPFAPEWTARVGASYEFGLGRHGLAHARRRLELPRARPGCRSTTATC